MRKKNNSEEELKRIIFKKINETLSNPFTYALITNPENIYLREMIWKDIIKNFPAPQKFELKTPADYREPIMCKISEVIKFIKKAELNVDIERLNKIFEESLPSWKHLADEGIYKRNEITVGLYKEVTEIVKDRNAGNKISYDSMSLTGFIMLECGFIKLEEEHDVFALKIEFFNGNNRGMFLRALRDLTSAYVNSPEKLKLKVIERIVKSILKGENCLSKK